MARRRSKEQYGISSSVHVSSSFNTSNSSLNMSQASIDYDPYQKYQNPAANGGAKPQVSPINSNPGYGVPPSPGSMRNVGVPPSPGSMRYVGVPTSAGSLHKNSVMNRVRSTESMDEIGEFAEGLPNVPNLGMSQRINTTPNLGMSQRISTIPSAEFGPTNGLVSEGDPVRCHKIDYEIKGQGMQMVEIELDPDETCIAEAGAMMFIEEYIYFDTKLGDGTEPKKGFFKKLVAAGGRIMAGDSLFLTHFTNKGLDKSRVAFGAPFPGVIVPINLAEMPSEKITCQRDSFLCAAYGTKVTCSFNKRIGSGFFGGEGFVLQKLEGDGMAFLHASGHIIKRELDRGRIRLDTGCLVAFSSGIDFEIEAVKGLKSMYFSGDGCFLAILKGTGTIWMQSLPISRIADRIQRNASHFRSDESG